MHNKLLLHNVSYIFLCVYFTKKIIQNLLFIYLNKLEKNEDRNSKFSDTAEAYCKLTISIVSNDNNNKKRMHLIAGDDTACPNGLHYKHEKLAIVYNRLQLHVITCSY